VAPNGFCPSEGEKLQRRKRGRKKFATKGREIRVRKKGTSTSVTERGNKTLRDVCVVSEKSQKRPLQEENRKEQGKKAEKI